LKTPAEKTNTYIIIFFFMSKLYILFTAAFLLGLSLTAQTNLIPFGSAWKYLDNGSNQNTVWKNISFNDGSWKTGNGKFGYGITNAATIISYGNNARQKYITTYFRKSLEIADATSYTSYTISVKRDDGAGVYVNGLEVYRNNLPTGALSYTTKAYAASDNGTANQTFQVNASAFVSGTNVIAVEIHQDKGNTTDMAFDLAVVGNSDLTAPAVISSNRQSPTTATTSATSVTYRVTFSEKVTGVDTTDFAVTTVTGAVTGSVASNGVSPVGTAGDTYDVTVSSITGEGTLRLDLNPTGTGIKDAAGNAISGGYTGGQTYTIQAADLTAPMVVSSNRQSPTTDTVSATAVTYRVPFSEKVTGVDSTDFAVTTVTGAVNGTVAGNGVSAVGTAGDMYDVTVSSITGEGTLRLDLKASGTGIADAAGNVISGGYTSGETYTIQAASHAPDAPSNPSPANGAYSSPSSTTLCTTVSDADNDQLRVRYYGRKKATTGKFTIIMLPDTQNYTFEPQGRDGAYNTMFKSQTSWIANNRATKNIVYVGHLGDCVEHGDTFQVEWKRVDTAMKTIESSTLTGLTQGIPYGVSVGNHDQTPRGDPSGATTFYNQYFGTSRFSGRSYYGGHFGTNNDNQYQLFSAGGLDFLIICPEFNESTSFSAAGGVLDWAESLIKMYPNRKVIVMSHFVAYADANGNGIFSNLGKAIYNRLKIYPNFILMIGGHISSGNGETRRSDTYNGNTVHTVVSDYQFRTYGGNGKLRIYEFNPSINNIAVKTYSPYTNTYETDSSSQFNLSVNLSSTVAPYDLIGEVSNVTSSTNACVSWPSLQADADYEWYAEAFDGQSTTSGPAWSFNTKITQNKASNNNAIHKADMAEPILSDHLFSLFPNPNYTHELTLMFHTSLKEEVLVEVMDVTGHLQIKKVFRNTGTTISLKHKLSAGTYIIKVKDQQHQEVKKFIVIQ